MLMSRYCSIYDNFDQVNPEFACITTTKVGRKKVEEARVSQHNVAELTNLDADNFVEVNGSLPTKIINQSDLKQMDAKISLQNELRYNVIIHRTNQCLQDVYQSNCINRLHCKNALYR